MTAPETIREEAGPFAWLRRSLSAKLLVLTVIFVLFVELLFLIPSISYRRISWLTQRIEAAYLVGLALEAPEQEMIDEKVAQQLFSTANILGVTVDRGDSTMLIFAPDVDDDALPPMHHIDLRDSNVLTSTGDAWATVFSSGDDMVRVVGEPTFAKGDPVGVIVSQRALRRDLRGYAANIFWASLGISTLTAGLVYWTLNLTIVSPVRRLRLNMTAFQENPEDSANIIRPSGRRDEIGVAEKGLAALEARINGLLSQRRRLAALGAGVSKISHDLRNILASAQLMSDRLANSDDPRVRKLSPRLIQSLDRAIALARDALNYSRMEPGALTKTRFGLRALVEEVFADTTTPGLTLVNEAPAEIEVVADRDQVYRALLNLVRNAIDAHGSGQAEGSASEKRITIRIRKTLKDVLIDVADNGPGVPEAARAHLFEPFRGSSKPGGSGLGVAIAHEILRAHGGALDLAETGPGGATFTLTLPDA
ncbi:MAG: sensor histidine kinase [Amphiplicatus sp.]